MYHWFLIVVRLFSYDHFSTLIVTQLFSNNLRMVLNVMNRVPCEFDRVKICKLELYISDVNNHNLPKLLNIIRSIN